MTTETTEIAETDRPQWPENGSCADVPDLIAPFAKIFRQCYQKKRKQPEEIVYEGYNLPQSHNGVQMLAGSLNISARFSPEELEYHQEEQGRDLIDVLLWSVLNVGMEQGVRYKRDTLRFESGSLARAVQTMTAIVAVFNQYEFEEADARVLKIQFEQMGRYLEDLRRLL